MEKMKSIFGTKVWTLGLSLLQTLDTFLKKFFEEDPQKNLWKKLAVKYKLFKDSFKS